ncbi:MAG: hypothetical protein GWN71_11070, partial [Gammaproteobacteria bacterium]|nr:hypothetical protein [Gemmatimonadota bacterium]NIU74098.1 hypothetical protein [Gammaproteobacteria bacterium]
MPLPSGSMAEPTRIHPTLMDRLSTLAGDPAVLQAAFAQVSPEEPDALQRLVARIIDLRRQSGTAPSRQIPARSASDPPDWLCNLAGEPDTEARKELHARWPTSQRISPLERPMNPLLRLYIALAFRAESSFSLPRRRWPLLVHVLRWLGLAAVVWIVFSSTHAGIAILVLAVAGIWMLYATP